MLAITFIAPMRTISETVCLAFSVGSVTQYIALITKVSGGMSSFVSNIGLICNNTPFLVPFEYLDIPNNMYQGSLTVEKRRDRKYQVEFRNVSFKYPGSDNWALCSVNMKFEIGKRLAVVRVAKRLEIKDFRRYRVFRQSLGFRFTQFRLLTLLWHLWRG